ncbi:hypothetical protein A1O3_00522 [Capronia epimyces CBS 606.96]|uniref:PNPLA domain-containing protein n=1 Tax=Capronia epimyces CBS 606.96 TaxID=1182542 RepID=W9YGF9_9EURO|nr:uncharacterized protein A1O3_00522 [Capronia epimyces CBS 606.96]EXJ91972.1 hypothetical protein A1O3_00522 [Capronia epimyces CBS 606.96]
MADHPGAGEGQLRLLSLDGGGVRGLSSLLILRKIMREVGAQMNPPREQLKPCEYFDLIGGTSTGGIIAIMLGRLRMSVDECLHEYERLSEAVFGKRKKGRAELYSATALEEVIQSVIRRKLGQHAVHDPLQDPFQLRSEKGKVIVFSIHRAHANTVQAQGFRSYPVSFGNTDPCTIWEAARATSAASTFFKAIDIAGVHWCDAALGFNNPTKLVLAEAFRLWGDHRRHFDENRIGVLLSIGTGESKIVSLGNKHGSLLAESAHDLARRLGIDLRVLDALKAITTRTNQTALEVKDDMRQRKTRNHWGGDRYFRFNVDRGLDEVALFQYEKIEEMKANTSEYFLTHDEEFNNCTTYLARLEDAPRPPELGLQLFHPPDTSRGSANVLALEEFGLTPDIYAENETSLRRKRELEGTIREGSAWPTLVIADIFHKESLEVWASAEAAYNRDQGKMHYPTLVHRLVQQRLKSFEYLVRAKQFYELVLARQAATLGPGSLDQAWTAHRLGRVYRELGRPETAWKYHKDALAGFRQHLGAAHHKTETCTFAVTQLEQLLCEEPGVVSPPSPEGLTGRLRRLWTV